MTQGNLISVVYILLLINNFIVFYFGSDKTSPIYKKDE